MIEAATQDTAGRTTGQHDPYLINAEGAARRAFHNGRTPPVPAHHWSRHGLRVLIPADLSIGSRVDIGYGEPMTLIGGTHKIVIVRADDGTVVAGEFGELGLGDNREGIDYNDEPSIAHQDQLSHLANILAELQQADAVSGLDAETVGAAEILRKRIAGQLEAVCAQAFITSREGAVDEVTCD